MHDKRRQQFRLFRKVQRRKHGLRQRLAGRGPRSHQRIVEVPRGIGKGTRRPRARIRGQGHANGLLGIKPDLQRARTIMGQSDKGGHRSPFLHERQHVIARKLRCAGKKGVLAR